MNLLSDKFVNRLALVVSGIILFGMILLAVGVYFAAHTTDAFSPAMLTAHAQSTETSFQTFIPIIRVNDPWTNPVGIETTKTIAPDGIIAERIDDLETSWVRLNSRISWKNLQPNLGGPIQWDLLDTFETELEVLKSQGIRPIVIVDDFPLWATTHPTSCSPLKPEYYDEFAAFVGAIVNRYKLSVKDWEIGNEVDIDPDLLPPNTPYGCWGNIDDLQYYGGFEYGNMLKLVGQTIDAADPYARVWHGGLLLGLPNTTDPALGKPENFLRGVLAAGAAPYFDILPYHAHGLYYGGMRDPYISPSNPWYSWGGGVRGKARYLRAIMQEYGIDKPMMVNEIGIGCESTSVYCDPLPEEFFQFKADIAVRLVVRAVNENLMGIVWFPLEKSTWRNTGLLESDLSPEPAYDALVALKDLTRGAAFLGPIDYANANLEAYAYKLGGNRQLHVLWALSGDPPVTYNVSVPKSSFIQAYDRDGNEIMPIDAGDNWEIPVGFSPVYIQRTP